MIKDQECQDSCSSLHDGPTSWVTRVYLTGKIKPDGLVKRLSDVTPEKAGVQPFQQLPDSGLRRNDSLLIF
jgi:hypothetical protein